MPDPLLYLQAFVLVASASAFVVLALAWRRRLPSAALANSACVAGVACGHIAGYYWLQLSIGWPPASALDRYLVILLPAVLVVELIAALPRFPLRGAWALRVLLAASLGRVLLHRSVYLDEWTAWQELLALVVCALLPMVVWALLARLAERSPGLSLPLALALAMQGAGVAIMLGGYLRGGAAALVAAAALLGASLASARMAKQVPLRALVGIGMVSLCSLLIIGVFFGRLSTAHALVLLAAPLLCWLTELPGHRPRLAWSVAAIRLAVVAAVIAIVLLIAKGKFDREFRPLLLRAATPSNQAGHG